MSQSMSQNTISTHTLAHTSFLELDYLLPKPKACEKIPFKIKPPKIHRQKVAVITENERNQTTLIFSLLQKPEGGGQPCPKLLSQLHPPQSYGQLLLFSRIAKMKARIQFRTVDAAWLFCCAFPQSSGRADNS